MEETVSSKESKFKTILKNLGYFLSSKIFLKNLAYMLLTILGLLFLVHFGMKWYTQHGKSLQVPSFANMTFKEAQQKASNHNLSVIINDSIWTDKYPPGTILKQSPEALSSVKKNRSVYLTITKFQAEEAILPKLAGNDNFDYYKKRLALDNITLKVRQKRFNNQLQDKTILYIYVDGERLSNSELNKGFKVKKGTEVEAVITTRGAGSAAIPDLKCKTLEEAEFLVNGTKLSVGSIFKDGTAEGYDGTLYVWKQEPRFIEGNTLKVGSSIDIHVTRRRPSNCR